MENKLQERDLRFVTVPISISLEKNGATNIKTLALYVYKALNRICLYVTNHVYISRQ